MRTLPIPRDLGEYFLLFLLDCFLTLGNRMSIGYIREFVKDGKAVSGNEKAIEM